MDPARGSVAARTTITDLDVGTGVIRACNEGLELSEALGVFSRLAGSALGGSCATVYLVSDDGLRLERQPNTFSERDERMVTRILGEAIPDIAVPLGLGGWHDRVMSSPSSIATRQVWEIEEAMRAFDTPERLKRLIPSVRKLLGIESMMSTPIIIGGLAVGMVDIHSADSFTEEHLRRLDALVVFLIAVLEGARLRSRLREFQESSPATA